MPKMTQPEHDALKASIFTGLMVLITAAKMVVGPTRPKQDQENLGSWIDEFLGAVEELQSYDPH